VGAKLTAHERALRLLTVRPRSVKEIRDRLRRAGFESEEIEDVISRLESVDLLDDRDFAQQLTDHAVGVKRVGRRALVSSLMAKGVDRATIDEMTADLGDEEARAEELARTRLGRLSTLEHDAAYRRLSGFLIRRGYDGSVAHRVTARVLSQ
jgi:SOS response regulatory protein OraA/RecX